jgi:hypothetical protein
MDVASFGLASYSLGASVAKLAAISKLLCAKRKRTKIEREVIPC